MKLKPCKEMFVHISIMAISMCVADAALITIGGVILAVLLSLWIIAIMTMYIFAVGKTVELDHNGYTISLLSYRRSYAWDEIPVKCYIDCRNVISYKRTYADGVLFSYYPVKPPKRIGIPEFCFFHHPLSTCFVVFPYDEGCSSAEIYPPHNLVDKSLFCELMRQWGVPIENLQIHSPPLCR